MKTNKLLLRSFGILMLVLAFMLFNNKAWAQNTFTWTGASNTNWANFNNWSESPGSGDYPGQSDVSNDDIVEITNQTHEPILSSSLAHGIATLTIDASSVLSVTGGNLLLVEGTLTDNGELNCDATSTVQGASLGTLTGIGQIDVTFTASCTCVDDFHSQYSSFNTYTTSGLTVDYEDVSAAQYVEVARTFGGIIINNSHGVTMGVTTTINGNLTLTSGTLSVGSNEIDIAGNITGTGANFVYGTGTVVFDGTSAQSFVAISFNNLTIDGTSNTISPLGTTIISGNLALTSGTLSAGANEIDIAGNITGTGSNFTAGTGTVVLNGTSSQSLVVMTFNNLTVNNPSSSDNTITVVTSGSTTNINGTMTMNSSGSGGATFQLGGPCTIGSGGLALTSSNSNDKFQTVGAYLLTVNGDITGNGSLDLTGNGLLHVTGSLTSGLIAGSSTGSTVTFDGPSPSVQTVGIPLSSITFNNVVIGISSGTTVTLAANNFVVNGTLDGATGSTLNIGDGTNNIEMDLDGNLIGTFTLNAGTSIVQLQAVVSGTSTPTSQTINAHEFWDVENNQTGLTLQGDVIIDDNLDFDAGNIILNGHSLTLKAGAHGSGPHAGGGNGPTGVPGVPLSFNGGTPVDQTYDGSLGYVQLNSGLGDGYLVVPVTTSAIQFFPVGPAANDYTPIALQSSTTPAVQTSVRVGTGVLNGRNPQNFVTDSAVKITWAVNPATLTTFDIGTQWGGIAASTINNEGSAWITASDPVFLSYRANQNAGTIWNPIPSDASNTPTAAGDWNTGTGQWYLPYSTSSASQSFPTGDGFVATGLFGTFTPLPVSLLTFGAQYQDGHVNLNWTTASEQNNAYFDVERATDAANWTSIGQVQGHGTSNVMNSYMDIDNLAGVVPTGTIYYRLKQVDFNGNFEYSMIRSVNLTDQGPALAMYPNPTSNTLNVNWTSATDDNTVLRLINMSGVSVYTQSVTGKGMIQKQIDMSTLPSGIYYVQVISGNGSTVNQAVYKN